MKDGAHIVVSVVKEGIGSDGTEFVKTVFPSIDILEIHFFGTAATWLLSRLYMRISEYFLARPSVRIMVSSALLVMLAPLTWYANVRAARRQSGIFSPTWTSFVIDFTVKRAHPLEQGTTAVRQQMIAAAAQP